MVLQVLILQLFLLLLPLSILAASPSLSKPGCPEKCGNITIPYPFGIGKGCYLDDWFEVGCGGMRNDSAYLNRTNLGVDKISFRDPNSRDVMEPGTIVVRYPITTAPNCSGQLFDSDVGDMTGSPFLLTSMAELEFIQAEVEWAMPNSTAEAARLRERSRAANSSFSCREGGYADVPTLDCICKDGFEGNPYLPNGCQDIDECANLLHPCRDLCINTYGGYRCDVREKSQTKIILIGLCAGLGLVVFMIMIWWLCKFIRKRRKMKLKEKYFKRNGGLLLQQQLSSKHGNVDSTKLFTSKELEKATDSFNENRVLGRGGQGTVYKGMLPDGRIVAVKKSKVDTESEIEPFINEVVILSQVIHRNVVNLLGCCLETEVPLLVYEFVPNGNLFEYLHSQNEEFTVTWEKRLQLGSEVAAALYYLHSSASIPIYHRDIKSSNILLDDKFRAKIADFGTSRSVDADKTHLTTLVQGTFGYLDPEYFQSSQFTDKSDVYSFGVVLVELLTGQRAISISSSREGRSLATYFIASMEGNELFKILDARVLKEGREGDVIAVADLAKSCLNLNGKLRPAMREVSMELERIRAGQVAPKGSGFDKNYEEIEETRTWDDAVSGSSGYDTMTVSVLDVHPLLESQSW